MKERINDIILIALVVFVTLQVRGCFDKTPPNEKLIRAEEQIKSLEKERQRDSVVFSEKLVMYDSLISLSKQKVVIISGQYNATKKEYEKIPIIVNDFDREQLRRAIANY